MPTLEFKGKQHVYAHHLTVPYRPLIPDPDKSVGDASGADGNLIIHGDNLHALKALLPRYAGRVKCIYIDPPYNTGNESWVYNDNVNGPMMQEWLRQHSPVDGEDLERHEKWLCMMWPRLQLLRELLSEDGVIFVSIDDHEQHHLRMLMHEIFGEANYLATLIWNKQHSQQQGLFKRYHEFVHVYARDASQVDGISGGDGEIEAGALKKISRANPASEFTFPPGVRFEAKDGASFTGTFGRSEQVTVVRGRLLARSGQTADEVTLSAGWTQRDQMERYFRGEDVYDTRGQRVIEFFFNSAGKLKYRKERDTITPPTLLPPYGMVSAQTAHVTSLFGERVFDAPKPVGMMADLLKWFVSDGDTVLDSFAGSGTTAEALLRLNREDGGNRRFILVECEDYADSVTAERVRRVIAGVPGAKNAVLRAGLGGSFTYCTLGDPVTVEGLLTGETLPTFATLAAWLLHTATGVSASTSALSPLDDDGLFYEDEQHRYYLLYEPDLDFLRSKQAVLNEERASRIGKDSRKHGKEAVVFAAAKYLGQRDLSEHGVTFSQLPWELWRG